MRARKPSGCPNPKGPGHVHEALPAAQRRLPRRVANPRECERKGPGPEMRCYAGGKQRGLVVSPFGEAGGMKRNRNHQAISQRRAVRFEATPEQVRQGPCEIGPAPVLETRDGLGHSSAVFECRQRAICGVTIRPFDRRCARSAERRPGERGAVAPGAVGRRNEPPGKLSRRLERPRDSAEEHHPFPIGAVCVDVASRESG
jgi:hypothetical protein